MSVTGECGHCGDTTRRGTETVSGETLCPLCIEITNAVPADQLETVVVVGRSAGSDVYHAPDNDGEALCKQPARRSGHRGPDPSQYREKDPAVLPHHDLCRFCKDRLCERVEA